MGLLEKFYTALVKGNSLSRLNLPHRDVIYTKAHLEAKFNREFTVEEVQDLLDSTGIEYRD